MTAINSLKQALNRALNPLGFASARNGYEFTGPEATVLLTARRDSVDGRSYIDITVNRLSGCFLVRFRLERVFSASRDIVLDALEGDPDAIGKLSPLLEAEIGPYLKTLTSFEVLRREANGSLAGKALISRELIDAGNF